MGARLGARSHSVVVDDDRSMNKQRQGTRRGSTARARTLHQGLKRTGLDSQLPFSVHCVQKERGRSPGFSTRPERRTAQSDRTNRPCSSLISPAYANIRITEARWAEPRSPIGREKRRRVFLRIRTLAHAGRPFFLSPKSSEGDSAAPLGVVLQQELRRRRRGYGLWVEEDGGGMMLARE